jgi:hypothetical protein
MEIAEDTRKKFELSKLSGKWSWYEKNEPETLYEGFDTFTDALYDAVEPYVNPLND